MQTPTPLKFDDYDVICLQETHSCPSALQYLLSRYALSHHVFCSSIESGGGVVTLISKKSTSQFQFSSKVVHEGRILIVDAFRNDILGFSVSNAHIL